MAVEAPAHYQVVSNGRLVEEKDLPGGRRLTRWRQSVPIAPWLYALEFFATLVGPYSCERLANVQANGLRGGMEAATAVFYGDESVSGPRRR